MESTQNILLNSSKNKKETNENVSLQIEFSGNMKLLPEDTVEDSLNSYDIYLNERKESNKFRLVVNINPFCSNVLFNPFTEIVKNEGTESVVCLNYEDGYTENKNNLIGKSEYFVWHQYDAIRDTQLSNETCGFEYHCGIDIFNNHILRNKTLKAVNFNETNSLKTLGMLDYTTDGDKIYGKSFKKVKVNELGDTPGHQWQYFIETDFNTIDDYMRDKDGWVISEHFPKIVKKDSVRSNLETIIMPLHLYQNYDILSFRDCIKEKLLENNGWYGFSNPSTLGITETKNGVHQSTTVNSTFDVDKLSLKICPPDTSDNVSITAIKTTSVDNIDASRLDINKTINNKEYCDYIDMYPGRDLYSFTPKYNEGRKRIEKNWNYCLTYPSKNVIKNDDIDFPFFRIDDSGNTSLKVYMFDEGTVDDDGTQLLTIYTVCQHGLMEGDEVNIYKSNDIFYDSVEVIHVIDKYIFQVFKNTSNMSDYWIEVENRNVVGVDILNPFQYSPEESPILPQKILDGILQVGGNYFPICESNRCNVDPNAQDIHIRRVVSGVECKYYVRKFSRLPNFKFRDEEVNDYTLYDDSHNKKKNKKGELTLIEKFSKPGDKKTEFESHISKLGFASTSYGDDSTEIVFTDDINTSFIRDNLGRPLSDIFLTIIKNNKGYKEWYGIGKGITINSIDVEFSHCFGKVNGSFLLSDYYREYYLNGNNNVNLYDVRDITANSFHSLLITNKVDKSTSPDSDEIEFSKDWEYYGDICCFSPIDCDEQSIQYAMHRFNTVQRELVNYDAEDANRKFNNGKMYYDEILHVENSLPFSKAYDGDPYEPFKRGSLQRKKKKEILATNLYHTTKEELNSMLNFQEGYYYQPHYRISVKTISSELSKDENVEYEIVEIRDPSATTENDRTLYELKTSVDNLFSENEKAVLYKKSINKYYFITVYAIIDFNRFICTISDESGNHDITIDGIFDIENINDYTLVKKHDETPDYARLINDGSCRYVWRKILSNGVEDGDYVYPFTNGAFYINRQINFFLRRQDPKKFNLGFTGGNGEEHIDFVPDGESISNYPNFNVNEQTNYEANEIKEC